MWRILPTASAPPTKIKATNNSTSTNPPTKTQPHPSRMFFSYHYLPKNFPIEPKMFEKNCAMPPTKPFCGIGVTAGLGVAVGLYVGASGATGVKDGLIVAVGLGAMEGAVPDPVVGVGAVVTVGLGVVPDPGGVGTIPDPGVGLGVTDGLGVAVGDGFGVGVGVVPVPVGAVTALASNVTAVCASG